MTWSSAWRAALREPHIEPIILIDVGGAAWTDVTESTGLGSDSILGATFSSHAYVPGVTAVDPDHLVSDIRTSGQKVRLREWTINNGGFSFALTSTRPGEANLPFTPLRGVAARVRMGFAGMTSLGFEAVAYGMVDNITHDGDTWWVKCRDMWGVARTRPSNLDTGTDPDQFFALTEKTTILSDPWDSNTGDNLPVDLLDYFEKDARAGAVGVAYIEGDSDRAPWWFVWSSKSAASGAGNLIASGSADWFGNTTGARYPADTIVRCYGVITGQPWNIAARLLRSTGAESSGGFDTLPKDWGIGLPLHLINATDVVGIGSHPAVAGLNPRWTPFFLAPVPDMLQAIQQGLGQFNMWPVQYEDQLSIRLAYDYLNPDYGADVVDNIDDDWISEIEGHDLYHPDCAVEYHRVGGMQDAVGALYSLKGDAPRSRPWLERYEKTIAANGATVTIEGSDQSGTPNVMTSWSAGTAESLADSRTLTTRAHTWYTRIPEYLKITTRGLRYAPLVPGDLVSITSRHIIGREGLYTNTVGMITGIVPDWIRGSVSLEIAILPHRNTP